MFKFFKSGKGIILLIILLIFFAVVYLYLNQIVGRRDTSHDCGSWSTTNLAKPTCKCSGEIVKMGDPDAPADASGAWYQCNGDILP